MGVRWLSRVWDYGLAFCLGLALVLWCFPLRLVEGGLPSFVGEASDFTQHLIGQVYWLDQPLWPLRHPVMMADRLGAPAGTNVALVDAIPLELIVLKALHFVSPHLRQGVSLWHAVSWLLQPVAGVFAVRGWGVRSRVVCAAAAVMAVSMPTFLFRVDQAAIGSHWIILGSVGLLGRCVDRTRSGVWLAAFVGLVWAAILVHGYLLALSAVLLCAVPVLRCSERMGRAAVARGAFAAALGVCGAWCIGALFGFWVSRQGYGAETFSMNLLSPLWPGWSWLFHAEPMWAAAGTGQLDGYQYLGAGLLLLLGLGLALPVLFQPLFVGMRRWWPLVVICGGVAVFSLSREAFCGDFLLYRMPFDYPGQGFFRAPGRAFWLVSYLMMVGLLVSVPRSAGRFGAVLVVVAAGLQFADASTLRAFVHRIQVGRAYAPDPAQRMRERIVSDYSDILVRPRIECMMRWDRASNEGFPFWLSGPYEVLPWVYAAAVADRRVDSMYMSRLVPGHECRPEEEVPRPVSASTLVVLGQNGGVYQMGQWRAQGLACALVGRDAVCARRLPDYVSDPVAQRSSQAR